MATALTDQGPEPETLSPAEQTRPAWPVVAWHAIRPRTLPLALSPVVAGAALGWVESGAPRPVITGVALLCTLAIQIGTNLHNDAADTLNHTDDSSRRGPARVTQQGWMTPRQVLNAAHFSFALAVVLGMWLVSQGGWPILLIGLLSVLTGYAYSSGPWPISRGPLGELVVILFFGLVAVGGMVYLHTGTVGPPALLMGLVVGLPAAAVLLVNNTRDRLGDTRAGRRTLAILIGPRRSVGVYGLLLATALVGLATLALMDPALRGAAPGLICAPLAWRAWRAFAAADAPADFNATLARTGGLQAVMTTTTALGLIAI